MKANEMEDRIAVFRYTKKAKFFIYALNVFILIVLTFGLIEATSKSYDKFITLIILPAFLIILIGTIYISKLQIIISNDFIEKKSFFSKKIYFKDITIVVIQNDSMILKSDVDKIHLTKEFEKRDEIFNYVINKIKNLPGLKVQGFKSEIKKYFQYEQG